MHIKSQIVVAVTLYKILSLVTGLTISYLGYRLFCAGIISDAGTITGSSEKSSFSIRNAAPGTFFSLFGALIVGFAIFTRLTFVEHQSFSDENDPTKPHEKHPQINLPDKPSI